MTKLSPLPAGQGQILLGEGEVNNLAYGNCPTQFTPTPQAWSTKYRKL